MWCRVSSGHVLKKPNTRGDWEISEGRLTSAWGGGRGEGGGGEGEMIVQLDEINVILI